MPVMSPLLNTPPGSSSAPVVTPTADGADTSASTPPTAPAADGADTSASTPPTAPVDDGASASTSAPPTPPPVARVAEEEDPFEVICARLRAAKVGKPQTEGGKDGNSVSGKKGDPPPSVGARKALALAERDELNALRLRVHELDLPNPYYSVGVSPAPRFLGEHGQKALPNALDDPCLHKQLRRSLMHSRTCSVMDRAREFEYKKPRNQHDARRLAQIIDTMEAGCHEVAIEILWRWFAGLITADQNNNMQYLSTMEWAPPTQVLAPSLSALVHKMVKRAEKS